MGPSQRTKTLTPLPQLTRQEKLALGALRLKERYSGLPGYGPSEGESEDAYWDNMAASRFNAWMLPPLSPPQEPKPLSNERSTHGEE